MIALGSAKLFGVDLINNFNHPYYAPNIQQFWRRWHISLMLWFRDYVYVPLGGNRRGRIIVIRNVLIVMALTALWHGANYTFLIWGFGHGALLMLHRLFGWARQQIRLPSLGFIGTTLGALLTFHAVTALWIFFRAPDVATAVVVLSKIATLPLSEWHVTLPYYPFYLGVGVLFVVFSLADYLSTIESRLAASALPIQAVAIASVLLLSYAAPFADVQFIYFQF
jgi:D-alanyl-lipoteichoic acid acyltransferase DltB (MBOAT superfamily)